MNIKNSLNGVKWRLYGILLGAMMVPLLASALAAESVTLDSPPMTVAPGSAYTVNVNYAAGTNRIIQVVLYNGSWQSFGSSYTSVSSGSGTKSLSVTVNSTAPVGSGYQWKATLFSSNWSTVIDDHIVTGVTVGTALINDNFNDGNDAGWTKDPAPSWAVVGNEYKINNPGAVKHSTIGNTSWRNYTLTAKIKLANANWHRTGLMVYCSGQATGYKVEFAPTDANTVYVYLKENATDIPQQYKNLGITFLAYQNVKVAVANEGTSVRIKVYVNDVEHLNYLDTTPTHTSGKIGVVGGSYAVGYVDDVAVSSMNGPPQPQTPVVAGESVASIQSKLNAVPAGGSLVFPAGSTFNFSGQSIRGKNGITVWADGIVTINGGGGAGTGGAFDFGGLTNWTIRGKAPGQGFVFNGSLINAAGTRNYAVGNCTFNDVPSTPWVGSTIRMDDSSYGLIINNDFNRCQGNVLGVYNLDNIVVDGNIFTACFESFAVIIPGTNRPEHVNYGRNIVVCRNVFTKQKRACIEIGPTQEDPPGSGIFPPQKFDGLLVENNWFDDFENRGPVPGDSWDTLLPISLVGQASVNTTVRNNFMRRGPNNPTSARGVAIEFTGSGECYGNLIWNFGWGSLMYKSGWNVHDNAYYVDGSNYINNPYFDVNGAGAVGTFSNNIRLSSPPPVPPKPTRIAW